MRHGYRGAFSCAMGAICAILSIGADGAQAAEKTRIAVVSSYHREYLWSQDTNRGVVAAFRKFGLLDSAEQGVAYTRDDRVESSTSVIQKFWMDTKRRSSRSEIQLTTTEMVAALEAFAPDILLLGDDNATNHLGNHYIDTELPVVFWGVNGTPLKYDLVDSIDHPGHNITGVYQAGYLRESVLWLQKLLPEVKRVAVLSDDSPTGRSKVKELSRFVRRGQLPVELVDTVITNSFDEWKRGALELAERVDAFVVLNHNTLKDASGASVDQLEAGSWYLRNIHKPGVSHEKQFVLEGILCAVDDSGYKQGFEAVRIASQILGGAAPAGIGIHAPERGKFAVNLERARMLGLEQRIADSDLIEERIDRALALVEYPANPR